MMVEYYITLAAPRQVNIGYFKGSNPGTTSALTRLQESIVLSGYEVPAKTFLFNATHNISRLEKHFRDADKFVPERFVRGDPLQGDFHSFGHLPFGHGETMGDIEFTRLGRKGRTLAGWLEGFRFRNY